MLYKSGLAALACALLAWGVVVRSESAAVSAAPAWHSESAPDLGSTIHADFDGDHKPDIVMGSAVGGSYVLQVRFSTDTPTASLRVSSGASGMRILSRDVNLDNDEDLIITSCTSPIPIAVFLGDGKGHFQPGNPWNYIPVGINTPYTYDPTTGQTGPAGNTEERRLPAGILSEPFAELRLADEPCLAPGTADCLITPATFARTPRAPPIACLL